MHKNTVHLFNVPIAMTVMFLGDDSGAQSLQGRLHVHALTDAAVPSSNLNVLIVDDEQSLRDSCDRARKVFADTDQMRARIMVASVIVTV